jgi:DNA (cytosine-5)-methyltransferase 1
MKIGSLCSGIGGLELGLERAMLTETVWQSEIDPYASQVLGRHWGVPNLGDMTAVDWTTVEPVDIVCAGYPCQPFSMAGQRNGSEDVRHLWPAVRDAIRHLGPSYVVLENVRGHLSLGFGEVLGDLADLGFDAEWRMLRASDVGSCHRRERIFIAAHAQDVGFERDGQSRGRRPGPADHDLAATDPDLPGLEGPEPEGRRLVPPGGASPHPDEDDRPEHVLGAQQPGQQASRRVDTRGRVLDWGPYAAAIARWERLHGSAPAPTDGGRLSPDFVCWMMGFPPGWVDGLTRTAALRCLGNAVHPWVSELFARTIAGEQAADVEKVDGLLPTPTSTHPGGSLEDYHGRLTDRESTFVPLNMVVEQVLR